METYSMTSKVFAGPMSESVPSSITGFAHARSRANSTTSFTYMPESEESSDWAEEEVISDSENEQLRDGFPAPSISQEHRKSSAYSGTSVEGPLLRRHASTRNDRNPFGRGGRINQKIYIATEDMTIVVSGFMTSLTRYVLYVILCILTGGLAFLLLRWLPRWRVHLVGHPKPLRECSWVVVEVR